MYGNASCQPLSDPGPNGSRHILLVPDQSRFKSGSVRIASPWLVQIEVRAKANCQPPLASPHSDFLVSWYWNQSKCTVSAPAWSRFKHNIVSLGVGPICNGITSGIISSELVRFQIQGLSASGKSWSLDPTDCTLTAFNVDTDLSKHLHKWGWRTCPELETSR